MVSTRRMSKSTGDAEVERFRKAVKDRVITAMTRPSCPSTKTPPRKKSPKRKSVASRNRQSQPTDICPGSPTTSRNHPTPDGDNVSTTAGDDPPDLMTAPPRPGFPSWKSQFSVYPEGLKPRSPTRIADEFPSYSSKQRATSVDSDPIFQPIEEQMLDADNNDIESERVENMKKPKKTSGSVKKPKQSSVPIKTSEKTPVQTKKPKKKLEVTGGSHRVTRASTVGPHPTIKDPRSATIHKVLVRGTKFDFSPTGINVFFESHMESSDLEVDFDKVISELTASVRCLWNNETSFPAADLSVPFDVGLLIFEEIVSHTEVTSSKPALPFPSLVYGILMSQQNIRTHEDVLEPPTKPIRISQKLRECKHMNDVQGENDCNRAEVEGDSVSGNVTGTAASGSGTQLLLFSTITPFFFYRRNWHGSPSMRRPLRKNKGK
ncbi:hypothetical protein L484_006894 [Morus notabilis]|uniref:Uncharacterized protein n=1 Tax=Morus notabilis TaxID=981085 RepID=W9RUV0_9ROSA|nr:hypothetical protein L484_006894 [Morus notabilis]